MEGALTEAGQQGDFVRVASCFSPTEAHGLKGVLEAAGLRAVVADAQVAQAHSWMTTALGGVRVLVPAEQAEQAAEVLAQYNQGDFALDEPDEEVAELFAGWVVGEFA